MSPRILVTGAICAFLSAIPGAQVAAPPQPGQAPPTKGVVIKGLAPVSDAVLTVTLPRPQEADLANGVHLMVLEDHRAPQITSRSTR